MIGRSTPKIIETIVRPQRSDSGAGPVPFFQTSLLVLLMLLASAVGIYAGPHIDVTGLSQAEAGDRLPDHWHHLNSPTITDKTDYKVSLLQNSFHQ